jgi:predicted kinase
MMENMYKVTLCRGISGSGKSKRAKQLQELSGAEICSADDFFMRGGVYTFDASKLKEAHDWCMRKFLRLTSDGDAGFQRRNPDKHVIVDNTHIELWELSPYMLIARARGYEVEVIRCMCKPEIAFSRAAHGVPMTALVSMAKRMEQVPAWLGKETVIHTDGDL